MTIEELRQATDTQLLEFVRLILVSSGRLSITDKLQLKEINHEFIRRDKLRATRICPYCNQSMSHGPRCSNCGAL